MDFTKHKSGYAAIIGKPNAGKSTLMNALLGIKLSITTHKAQTTRHRIMGIYSDDDHQIIFLDTPGIITPAYELQKSMMKAVDKAVKDADVVLFIHDLRDSAIPDDIIEYLNGIKKKKIVLLNKIDEFEQKYVVSVSEWISQNVEDVEIIPISAIQNLGLEAVIERTSAFIPLGHPLFPKDQLSEHPERFFVSELVREQIFLQFHQEIPYSCTVDIILYEQKEAGDHIEAEIIVNRDSQKGMLIGKGGLAIKKLGIAARKEIEEFLGRPVVLKLFVKSREGWRDKESFLKSFGYEQ